MHNDYDDDVSVVMSVAGPVQEIMVQMGAAIEVKEGFKHPSHRTTE